MRHQDTPEFRRAVESARAQLVASGADVPHQLGIGGPNGGCAPTYSSVDRLCYRGMQPLCDMQKCGARSGTVAPQAIVSAVVVPTTSQYFEPKAVRNVILDATDPDTNRRVFWTSVNINNFPQEAVDTQAPVAATTAGWWSDDWDAPDGYAVPVSWGMFSVAALTKTLDITGFNRYAAGAASVDAGVSVYGNAFDNLPPGIKLGVPAASCRPPSPAPR